MTRNHFPHQYAEISAENRPYELMPEFTTMEYMLDNKNDSPPVFLFVLDTCIIDEELAQLKQSILQSLMLLPENSMVGLITFGKNVHVHELSFDECPKSFVFRGDKELTTEQVATLLGFKPAAKGAPPPKSRFLLPVADCEFQLTAILEDLSKDNWPHKVSERPERSTGTSLAVAIGLLEATCKERSARIMMFIGGPPTVGPGMVVSLEYKDNIRSHHDISKGDVPFFKKAVDYYTKLGGRASQNGHVIDLFACSLDQVGLAEMKVMTEKTGGYMVLDDSFTRGVFLNSFKQVFQRNEQDNNDLVMCFSGQLQALTSREVKIAGAIGLCTSLEMKGNCIADNEIGIGNTVAWNLGGIDPGSTIAIYFESVAKDVTPEPGTTKQAYIQFTTRFRHSTGRTHLRVTTVAKPFADPKTEQGQMYIRGGFDQEAAAILMARYAVFKTKSEYTFDILRWLDRMLIRLVSKFGAFKKDDPASFRLSEELKYYPQFMFHLRRSQFLQVFNSSPDETAFFRTILLRECVINSITMIQPTLMAYSLEGGAQPVQLDVSSCASDRILVLDTFFHFVIWYGDTISSWHKNGLHLQPEYDYVAQLLNAPKADAQRLLSGTELGSIPRFPYPRFIECVEKGSQSRFLMAKLNPSITQSNMDGQQTAGEPPVFTEDVSLAVFLQHLRRLAVQSS